VDIIVIGAASLPHPSRAMLDKSSGARRGKREKYRLCVTSAIKFGFRRQIIFQFHCLYFHQQ
jgi:hypothetical protein